MSGAPDFSRMSNADLLAYIHTGQPDRGPAPQEPVPAAVPPPQPVSVTPLAPLPDRPQPDSGVQPALRTAKDAAVSFSSAIPIIGGALKEADAATAAAVAPVLEPIARKAPHLVQALMGYDPKQEIGNLPTFRDRYDAALNLQRFDADQFHADHPIADTGLKVGGAIGSTVVALPVLGAATAAAGPEAGLLLRSGTGALEGGLIGGADAYARGNGGLTDPSRISGAEGGAALGAAGGAVLPIAARVGGTAWRASGGKLVDAIRGERAVQLPDPEEAAKLATVLREGQPQSSVMKPDRADVESALVTAERPNLTTRASNVDDAYVRLARAADRQGMTPADMADAVRRLGPFGTLADTGESARDLLRAAVNRPGRGATIAEDNLTPRQNGVFDPESGHWTVRPSSLRLGDQAQLGLGLQGKDYHGEIDSLMAERKAASGPAYAKAYSAAPVDRAQLADFASAPDFADAYGRARAISQKEFVTLPDGSEKIIPLPEAMPDRLDWRTLDLMKQGLDDTISEAKRAGIGANDQGASKGYLQRFVGKLDGLNPDYKVARDAFAGPTAMKDALEEGRGLLSEDAPVVAANLAARPESERQMMRLGALQALQTKLGNANVTFDAANQAGLLKPNQLARFRELFPDPKAFADFYNTMQNEKTMFGTNKAAFGNSTTARQMLNVMEPSDPQLEGIAQAVPAAASFNPIALVRAIHRMGMEAPMREGVAETIASVLSTHDAGDLPQIVKRMTEAQRAAYFEDLFRNANGAASGAAAAQAAQRNQ